MKEQLNSVLVTIFILITHLEDVGARSAYDLCAIVPVELFWLYFFGGAYDVWHYSTYIK